MINLQICSIKNHDSMKFLGSENYSYAHGGAGRRRCCLGSARQLGRVKFVFKECEDLVSLLRFF